jgi:hypothetical protein
LLWANGKMRGREVKMRRVIVLLTVAAIMSVMMVASAAPAYAQGATNFRFDGFHFVFTPSGNFHFQSPFGNFNF